MGSGSGSVKFLKNANCWKLTFQFFVDFLLYIEYVFTSSQSIPLEIQSEGVYKRDGELRWHKEDFFSQDNVVFLI